MIEQVTESTFAKAPVVRRIAAFLTDHFMFSAMAACLAFLIKGSDFMNDSKPGGMVTPVFSILIPVFILYFAKDLVQGISPGRWIMGIMVRDEADLNRVPAAGRLILRNLFYVIWPVEFFVMVLNKDNKRLGDKMARTTVLSNPAKAKRSIRIVSLVAIFLLFVGVTAFFTASSMKSSEAYKTAIREIEASDEIRQETGGIKGYGYMPEGTITVNNGYGGAVLEIEVLGNQKDLEVQVSLIKEPNGAWQVTQIKK